MGMRLALASAFTGLLGAGYVQVQQPNSDGLRLGWRIGHGSAPHSEVRMVIAMMLLCDYTLLMTQLYPTNIGKAQRLPRDGVTSS